MVSINNIGFVSFVHSYPDAADEDVKRYERSFNKLPPSHKVSIFLPVSSGI